jgi:hypothetical protein
MNDEQTQKPPAAPKKPKKQRRKRTPKVAAVKVARTSEFPGMTINNCCSDCKEGRCVISGINVCAHPRKGGLQASQMGDREALARLGRAKDALSD